MTRIRAVFFDLGKTLIYPKDAWQPISLASDKALTKSLIDNGIGVDANAFPYEFIVRLNNYYTYREETLRETTTFRLLRDLLAEKGFRDVPAPILRAALDAKYAITQTNWDIEDDAHACLNSLRSKGYELALLSNAGDDPDVQTLLDKHKLRHYFSHIRTSAAAGFRKPHAYLFEEALRILGLSPQQCVMVGDTLAADILGANKLGIYSVWINRRVNKETQSLINIHPKAVIQSLAELPARIEAL